MAASWKTSVRRLIPPIAAEALRRRRAPLRFVGDFASWNEARAASKGYDDASIHDVVREAARAARDGRAAFERDGVAFAKAEYVWPVAAALLAEAAKQKGRLHVLDFGGSLGSFYYQHRSLFRGIEVRWAIVEQPAFVATGNREFADERLSFHSSINDACGAVNPSVVLFSSVLNYVEEPEAIVSEAVRRDPSAVIIDRTAFTNDVKSKLVVQHSRGHAYVADYPAWLLSRSLLLRHFFAAGYETMAEFRSPEGEVDGAQFGGFYFARRAQA